MEVDGALKYQSGQDVPDEKTREDAIRLKGWELVRSTGEDVPHPGRTEQKLLTTTYSVKVFVNFTRSGFLIENPLLAVGGGSLHRRDRFAADLFHHGPGCRQCCKHQPQPHRNRTKYQSRGVQQPRPGERRTKHQHE